MYFNTIFIPLSYISLCILTATHGRVATITLYTTTYYNQIDCWMECNFNFTILF